MNLKPLGDRVLIKPELPPTVTESGIHLAEERKPEQTGTVVAVGPCTHPRKAETLAVAARLRALDLSPEVGETVDEAILLLAELVAREPQVCVGDYVVFSWTAGQEIWVEDGEARYLLMRESDILCVVEGLEA